MLEKINHVKNIGRFYDVSISGTADRDHSFRKFNLIYADNGTGKSTFSTILKSLWENSPKRLIEKRTIGATDESTISLQINNKTYTFKNKQWNQTPEVAIEIFDEEFVAKNVFSPSGVELENRRELFNYIVLGEENVAKVEEVKQLNDLINGDLKTQIDNAENKLKKAAGISDIKVLDDTPKLDDNRLKTMRDSVEKNKKIITHAERITKEKKLEKITDFKNIPYADSISVDLGSLSIAAEYKAHVQTHNEWIKDGMEIIKNGEELTCPFCFQSIKRNNAVATYKTLFSEEYVTLREKVRKQITDIECIYSDAAVKNVIDLLERNNELCTFWHKLDGTIPETFTLSIQLKETVGTFKNALESLLKRKKDNLLEKVIPTNDETLKLKKEGEFRQAISNYNLEVEKINKQIQAIKDASQDVEELKVKNEHNRTTVVCNDVRYCNKETSKTYELLKKYRQQKKMPK